MTTASHPLIRTDAHAELRAALVMASLCVSAGVHGALAAMHASGAATAEFALFELAALAAIIAIVLLDTSTRAGAWTALALLTSMSMTYVVSRVTGLPPFGHEPTDTLGVMTVGIQLVGAATAGTLTRTRQSIRPAPLLICALIVVYSFLAAYAIPSVHHHTHTTGHTHAAST